MLVRVRDSSDGTIHLKFTVLVKKTESTPFVIRRTPSLRWNSESAKRMDRYQNYDPLALVAVRFCYYTK